MDIYPQKKTLRLKILAHKKDESYRWRFGANTKRENSTIMHMLPNIADDLKGGSGEHNYKRGEKKADFAHSKCENGSGLRIWCQKLLIIHRETKKNLVFKELFIS